jgi:cholesterol oxidase
VAQPPADIVVIGSGFGGSVAANRLALAGKRVLLLERGPWRDSVPVRSMGIERRSPFPLGRKAFTHFFRSLHAGRLSLRLNKAGMYEMVSFPGLYALAASAVGGGSTAYGGLLVPPLNKAMWLDRHPQLDPAQIERYYDKVIADMGAVRLSREHPLPLSIWDHFPENAGGRCRPAEQQPHVATLIPPTAAQAGALTTFGPAGVQRQYCSFDGDAFLGSPGGAKASVDFVYLAPVLDKGLTVRDLCEVTGIQRARPVDGPGYIVKLRDLTSGTTDQVHAQQVVLAAGTLNTLRLLFAGSRQLDGLAPMPALGRAFYGNGDLIAAWLNPATPVSSFRCSTTHGEFVVDGHESHHFGVAGLAGFDTWPIPAFVKRKLAGVFFMYAMGSDSGDASVTYANGRLESDYDYRKEPVYDDLRQAYRVISSETGNRVMAMKKPLTPHMSGGARLGANAGQGVVDHRGEIYGNPGLYVADAAALPAAPGGPPSVAIASWAHHVADGIVQRP